MTLSRRSFMLLASTAIVSSPALAADLRTFADTIYVGGDIVTMRDAETVEALAVRDGKILDAGPRQFIVEQFKGPSTKIVDLDGKALLPAFIDAHSHYINSLSVASQANVYAPPSGPGKDVDSIIAEIRKLADLVVLDRNPLTVDPMAIKEIRVVETIKEGRTIYSAA